MPESRWGAAVKYFLDAKGWTRKELAERAGLRPNTLTTLIRHGGQTDTKTLGRIASAFDVDIAELLMSAEQRAILEAHEDRVIERITEAVMRELSQTVKDLVRRELEQAGLKDVDVGPSSSETRRPRKRSAKSSSRNHS